MAIETAGDRQILHRRVGDTTIRRSHLPDAAGGDRTHDLRIKSPLLCQLSYGGQVRMIAQK